MIKVFCGEGEGLGRGELYFFQKIGSPLPKKIKHNPHKN